MKNLKRGDIIYRFIKDNPVQIYTVERTSKTRAFCNNSEDCFNIEYSLDGEIFTFPKDKDPNKVYKYFIESPEIKLRLKKIMVYKTLREFNYNKLPIEIATNIYLTLQQYRYNKEKFK